eukprot:9569717-Ditylum_brightwellii.AAC.1
MPQEVKEAKMAWVQLQTKCKCTTGLSDEDNDDDDEEEEGDIVEEETQGEEDLLGCAPFEPSVSKKGEVLMAQTMSSKKVIDIKTNEDNLDMSAFEAPKEKRRL